MNKSPRRAQQMILDLVNAGFPGEKIAREAGVSSLTISHIRNGEYTRITEKVFDRIWDYWSEKTPPKDQREAAREASETPVETPQKADLGRRPWSRHVAREGLSGHTRASYHVSTSLSTQPP